MLNFEKDPWSSHTESSPYRGMASLESPEGMVQSHLEPPTHTTACTVTSTLLLGGGRQQEQRRWASGVKKDLEFESCCISSSVLP